MICPNCKCEYIRGVTECADCGVALVDAIGPETDAIPKNVPIVAVWRGTDPADCGKVRAALENAGIPYTQAQSRSLFGSRPNELTLEIWVSEADQEKAGETIGGLDDRLLPEELTAEEAAALTLPDSDEPDGDNVDPQDLSQEWDEDDPAIEVWTGDSESLAGNLAMCLREVGIASRELSEDGRWRIVVRPGKETRAKEIIREVVEASPPE